MSTSMPDTDCFVGEIRIFAGAKAPNGWSICNGGTLSVSAYPALFSLIGTAFGGNGTTTFCIPNLQGRLAVGQGQEMPNNPTPPPPSPLPKYVMGQVGGVYTVGLNQSQMPAHTHTFCGLTAAAATGNPAGAMYATLPSPYTNYPAATATGVLRPVPDAGMMTTAFGPGSTGDGHSNIMPCLVINYIIALEGLYPSFN